MKYIIPNTEIHSDLWRPGGPMAESEHLLTLEPCNPTRTRPDPKVGSGRVQNSRVRVGSGLTNYEYVGFLSGLKITIIIKCIIKLFRP